MGKEKKLLIDWPTGQFVVGLDEVGRGCGAGPVVTAAVILPKGFQSPLIRDSKTLSEKQKDEAYKLIMENAISVSCKSSSVNVINSVGINQATINAMCDCIDDLSQKPDYVLIDGTVPINYTGKYSERLGTTLIPKGDDTYTCIAAASIVAKVRRDEYMVKLHETFPIYKWDSNKGYLTADHIEALKQHGATKYHRVMYVKNFV